MLSLQAPYLGIVDLVTERARETSEVERLNLLLLNQKDIEEARAMVQLFTKGLEQ